MILSNLEDLVGYFKIFNQSGLKEAVEVFEVGQLSLPKEKKWNIKYYQENIDQKN